MSHVSSRKRLFGLVSVVAHFFVGAREIRSYTGSYLACGVLLFVRMEPVGFGMRVLLLVNHRSSRGQSDLGPSRAILEEHGFHIDEVSLSTPGDIGQAIDSHGHAVDLVVLGGGDGTINAAVPALLRTGLPLGILPLGTANDFARTLGIPRSLEGACAVIAARQTRAIDVAYVNGKHFINDASLGLSVDVLRRAQHASKQRWGVISYAAQAFRALRDNRSFKAVIHCDDTRQRFSAMQITVGNGRYHGGGLTISQDARIDDGWLDLFALTPMPLWRLLSLGPSMWRGSHWKRTGVKILRGQHISITTSRPMVINTDGERATRTPARFSVVSRALKVLVPRGG